MSGSLEVRRLNHAPARIGSWMDLGSKESHRSLTVSVTKLESTIMMSSRPTRTYALEPGAVSKVKSDSTVTSRRDGCLCRRSALRGAVSGADGSEVGKSI